MINVALIGIGNCASSLVQGVQYYTDTPEAPGLILRDVCGFTASDIEFVAAFDADRSKVGKTLDAAILAGRNNTLGLVEAVRGPLCPVHPAPVFDGIGEIYGRYVEQTATEGDVDAVLESTKPDVLVNYLPVGSDHATRFWADRAIHHGIAFVNAIPSFIVSDPEWAERFRQAGVPCAGDDVKSQIGATIIHRMLAHLFATRGGVIDTTYQLNFGGNMDFMNMLEGGRIETKKKSKMSSVVHEVPDIAAENIHISPTGYVEFLKDQKIAYINVTGRAFGGAPLEIECKLKVWDSPNSAGVVIDLIRFTAAAARLGMGGPIPVCPYYFKSPSTNLPDDVAEQVAREFAGHTIPTR